MRSRSHEDGLTDNTAPEAGLLSLEDEGEAVGGGRLIRWGRTLATLTKYLDSSFN